MLGIFNAIYLNFNKGPILFNFLALMQSKRSPKVKENLFPYLEEAFGTYRPEDQEFNPAPISHGKCKLFIGNNGASLPYLDLMSALAYLLLENTYYMMFCRLFLTIGCGWRK